MEWFGLGHIFKGRLVMPSCKKLGHQLHQGAQVHIFMSEQDKTSYMRERLIMDTALLSKGGISTIKMHFS